jgi:hypothetical protein
LLCHSGSEILGNLSQPLSLFQFAQSHSLQASTRVTKPGLRAEGGYPAIRHVGFFFAVAIVAILRSCSAIGRQAIVVFIW